MKMKTLKDIEKEYRLFKNVRTKWGIELKAEAVKWVKYYENMGENVALLIHFFNLTEEDLQ
jgi:predicted transposase YbfD/YdcC